MEQTCYFSFVGMFVQLIWLSTKWERKNSILSKDNGTNTFGDLQAFNTSKLLACERKTKISRKKHLFYWEHITECYWTARQNLTSFILRKKATNIKYQLSLSISVVILHDVKWTMTVKRKLSSTTSVLCVFDCTLFAAHSHTYAYFIFHAKLTVPNENVVDYAGGAI